MVRAKCKHGRHFRSSGRPVWSGVFVELLCQRVVQSKADSCSSLPLNEMLILKCSPAVNTCSSVLVETVVIYITKSLLHGTSGVIRVYMWESGTG